MLTWSDILDYLRIGWIFRSFNFNSLIRYKSLNFPQLFFFIYLKISNYHTHICEPRGTYVSSMHICEPALFPLLNIIIFIFVCADVADNILTIFPSFMSDVIWRCCRILSYLSYCIFLFYNILTSILISSISWDFHKSYNFLTTSCKLDLKCEMYQENL